MKHLLEEKISDPEHLSELLQKLKESLKILLRGKEDLLDITLCALITGGHVLIEDVPGVGKTTFIKGLAKLLGLEMMRIQCTSDLLPADILGIETFDTQTGAFRFHRGPIFTQILLADELNRASPRTQSALLEAMGENQVSIGRTCYALPQPFIVFASQNPHDHNSTYLLPDSQLDRFAAKIKLGYPSSPHEMEILKKAELEPLKSISQSFIKFEELQGIALLSEKVHVSEAVILYAKRLIDQSRSHSELKTGISTRAGVSWIRMGKAKALLSGRSYLIPDDLQKIANPCLAHRIIPQNQTDPSPIIAELVAKTSVG